jgi:hypothetical protein
MASQGTLRRTMTCHAIKGEGFRALPGSTSPVASVMDRPLVPVPTLMLLAFGIVLG